jgi:multidrug efflux pump subunit AcrA (membrane-fusion protein)
MASPRVALALVLALAAAPAAARIYCCTDGNGRRVCGDILPAQCQTRAYNEINAQGVVKNKVDAPLTSEQRAQRDAEEARRKAEQKAAAEQLRRDQAMLSSYTSVGDIDAKRNRTVSAAQADIKASQDRLESAQARFDKLRQSAERLNSQGKPLPGGLAANLKESEADVVARRLSIEEKQKELVRTQRHFDEDRERFLELTGKKTAETPPAGTPAR